MAESFVNLNNARYADQRRVMQGIVERDECPFCPENLAKTHDEPVVREGKYWIVTPNKWPYEYTATHLLAIAKRHVERVTEFSDEAEAAGAELFGHVKWAELEYQIAAGGLAMRFGDTAHTGASVSHLHAHIIEPDPSKPEDAKVRFKIS